MNEETPSWQSLGLSEDSLSLIREAGYALPTPVQAATIPAALKGDDLIVSAQTGTGKTAAFLLPMIEKIVGREGTYGLIIAPTRELVQQTEVAFQMFGIPRGLRSATLIGGININSDLGALQEYPQFIFATPGRLCDHLERGTLWLDFIEMFVLDEADRMLDMGFAAQLSRIVEALPKERQTMLFSATIPPSVEKLSRRILNNPKRIAIGVQKAASTVSQRFICMRPDDKDRELIRLLKTIQGNVLIFTRTKLATSRVWRSLYRAGFTDTAYLSSNLEQNVREQVLAQFRTGDVRILVATDVVARGVHIDDIEHVINYDPPTEAEDYIHRVGRTGRAGATGSATTFLIPANRQIFREIERLSGAPIQLEFAEGFQQSPHDRERPHAKGSHSGGQSRKRRRRPRGHRPHQNPK